MTPTAILLYHHIGIPRPGANPELTVTPDQFRAQIEWLLERGYTGRSLSEFTSDLSEKSRCPSKAVVLTFDDGYADLAEHALPLLERHGFRATIFVVTGETGSASVWDRGDGFAMYPLLNAEQIRDWHRRGFEFGAHSRTHSVLTELPEDRLREETCGSHTDLKALVGVSASSFAYPYGIFNETVTSYVRQRFKAAVTVMDGLNDAVTDRYRLRRTMVRPADSLRDFRLRVQFGTARPARRYLARLRDVLTRREPPGMS